MKKIVLIVLLTAAGFIAFSQAEFALGAKGGLNFANLSKTSSVQANYDARTGYHFGAYAMVKVGSFAVQPEVLYSAAGSNVKYSAVKQDFSQSLVYLNIPILVKFYLPLGLNVYAGPQFGSLVSVKGKYYDGTNSVDLAKSQYKNSDKSLVVGAGFDAPFNLTVSARYIVGLSDITIGSNSPLGDSKNRMFQISLGYSFIKIGN